MINADALANGDGGKVILWADGHTAYAGQISAKGGQTGGNGGFVEVSGKNTLDFTGRVDTSAPAGRTGTLLLDPSDITISNLANSNISAGPTFTGTAADFELERHHAADGPWNQQCHCRYDKPVRQCRQHHRVECRHLGECEFPRPACSQRHHRECGHLLDRLGRPPTDRETRMASAVETWRSMRRSRARLGGIRDFRASGSPATQRERSRRPA